MKLSRSRLRLFTTVAIAAGAAVALALPAGAAVSVASQSPPVQVLTLGDTATLDAKGAVVFAPVQVVCPAGYTVYNLTVSLAERVGGALASGSGSASVAPCDGTPHEVQVVIVPTQQPFKKGVAYGQASVSMYSSYNYLSGTDEHNVQIVKP